MLTELRGGLLVRTDAILLALTLESAGHALTASDGKLMVSNGATLTAEDRAAITIHRLHLLAIAGYVPPQAEASWLNELPSLAPIPALASGTATVPHSSPPDDAQPVTPGAADGRQSGKARVRRAREKSAASLFPEAP